MEDRFGTTDKQHLALVRSFALEKTLHPCCVKAENLGPPVPVKDGGGAMVRTCRICHAKHYRTPLDPGRFGARLQQ